jgi:hypothetical protein
MLIQMNYRHTVSKLRVAVAMVVAPEVCGQTQASGLQSKDGSPDGSRSASVPGRHRSTDPAGIYMMIDW